MRLASRNSRAVGREDAENQRRGVTCTKGTATTGQSQISEKYTTCPWGQDDHSYPSTQKSPHPDYRWHDREGLSPPISPLFALPVIPHNRFRPIARSGGEEEARKSQSHLPHLSCTPTDRKPTTSHLGFHSWLRTGLEGRRERGLDWINFCKFWHYIWQDLLIIDRGLVLWLKGTREHLLYENGKKKKKAKESAWNVF